MTILERDAAMQAVRTLILYLGDDPTRDGLVETPRRFLAFLDELKEFTQEDVSLTAFESVCDDLVIEHDIAFSSLCEHHMLPYFGRAQVGYLPTGKVIGASKIARIVYKFAAGLTIQEHLTHDVAHHLQTAAGLASVAVTTKAQHMCMEMRGVYAHGASLSYSAMLGEFRTSPVLRAEFLALTR